MKDAPFDRVVIVEGGRRQELTVEEFLAVPLHVRVGVILKREVEFYADKEPFDRQEALRYLRDRRTVD